jgi:transposase-like protein
MRLKFIEEAEVRPELCICPHCQEGERIGVHQRAERLLICHACKKTFAWSHGTVFAGSQFPLWVIVLVLTLVGHGCPVPAIVAAFCLDARTVAAWRAKAGQHGQRVHEEMVLNGQASIGGQVQMDELCVTMQRGKVWMATAIAVFPRLFLGGAVSEQRDKPLIRRVVEQVHRASGAVGQALLFCVDGLTAYPKAILKTFYHKVRTGKVGRPRHLPWPDLHIAQLIKSSHGRKLCKLTRTVFHGCSHRVSELIACSQTALGVINTAFIERLNATFRANLPSLARRTRRSARTLQCLHDELFWCGTLYNFCSVHSSLGATPAMAAGLTDHLWSVSELLARYGPYKQFQVLL